MKCKYCNSLAKGEFLKKLVYSPECTGADRDDIISVVAGDLGDMLPLFASKLATGAEPTEQIPVTLVDALWPEEGYFLSNPSGHRACLIRQPDGTIELVVERPFDN